MAADGYDENGNEVWDEVEEEEEEEEESGEEEEEAGEVKVSISYHYSIKYIFITL